MSFRLIDELVDKVVGNKFTQISQKYSIIIIITISAKQRPSGRSARRAGAPRTLEQDE